MIITADNLKQEIKELGVAKEIRLRDSKFFCPSLKWLINFADYFYHYCRPTYKANQYDCEDFCIRALDRANDSLIAANITDDAGHALFIAIITIRFDAELNGIGGSFDTHATILCKTQEGWQFWEPQSNKITAVKDVPADTITIIDIPI